MLKRLLAPLGALVLVLGLASCGSDDDATDQSADEPTSDVTCTYVSDGSEAARPAELPPETPTETEPVEVTIETTAGDLSATLSADTTPCTVNSFLSLAEQGFYDDTPCPRISDQGLFILQCGDPTGTGAGGPGYSFEDEVTGSETYAGGTLAMANAGPDTNGSQFFVVYDDSQLAPAYTVFGTIDKAGIEVVEGIAADGNDGSNPAGGGTPNTPVDIVSVTVD